MNIQIRREKNEMEGTTKFKRNKGQLNSEKK